MRIKSVSFRSNIEVGRFQHLHIEMSADVAEGETAREVLDALKNAVAMELIRAKNGEQVKVDGKFTDLLTETMGPSSPVRLR